MTNSSNPLIDIGQLTEPITKLIETVSDGIGVLYEPTRIRRKAEADADATIIQAKAQLEVDGLNLRAAQRREKQELRRQKNIEAIVKQATKELPERVSSEKVDEDWIVQFFNFSQDVSNEEMQSLWAHILAGEVSHPGSFSLRTLNAVRLLRQNDARLFQKLCSFIVIINSDHGHIHNPEIDELLRGKRFLFENFLHLEDLGLVKATGLIISFEPQERVHVKYCDESGSLVDTSPGQDRRDFGFQPLTDIGKEIFQLCNVTRDDDYWTAVKKYFLSTGYLIDTEGTLKA